MRVYEFAKQKDLSSKEVLALLKKKGFDLASHMSVLSDKALHALGVALSAEKKEVSPEGKPKEKPVVVKKVQAVPQKIEKREAPKTKAALKKIKEISVDKGMPLCKAAKLMSLSEGELILVLLKRGIICNRNHFLSIDIILDLAHHFGIKVVKAESVGESLAEQRLEIEGVSAGGKVTRWPIVVAMGHVDHGKTTLLDYIRKMNTAGKERGGITQHLSAYEVDSSHGKIVFIDTPGHEAFSYMRKRGTSVTDIVVLVIAADDGIMPQTVEVINHAKEAGATIIVAINKIDKVDRASAEERVKRQLAEHDLLPEDWGGSVICVPISAKTGEGVDELLEMITLQAQMMELKADPEVPARGFILESKQEKGLGPVATVICLNGTIKIGDCFVCGSSTGRVRLLIDSFGKRISCAGPSIPVQVVGFDNFASLGDWLTVVSTDAYVREKLLRKKEGSTKDVEVGASGLADQKKEEKILLLIKVDTHGSREAALSAIKKLNKTHPEIPCSFQVVSCEIGNVSERDVDLAAHSGAILVALHVGIGKKAVLAAREKGLEIKEYGIIYRMTEALEELLMTYEEEISVRKKTGEVVVRKVFDIKKRGVIAGCYVSEGVVVNGNIAVCMRGGQKVGEGKIVSLQRERKTVKEVHAGHECGFVTDSFHDWKVDDAVHIFSEEKKKRSEV